VLKQLGLILKAVHQSKYWNSTLCTVSNEEKLAASIFCQVAALAPAMLCNFYLVKNPKIASSSMLQMTNMDGF
jgi:hypothetical protein